MRGAKSLLLALGDPLLESALTDLPGANVTASGCETATECLDQVSAQSPQAVLLSLALAPWPRALSALISEIRRGHPETEVALLLSEEQASLPDADYCRQAGATLLTCGASPRDIVVRWLQGGVPARPAVAPPRTAVPLPNVPTTTSGTAQPRVQALLSRAAVPAPPTPKAAPAAAKSTAALPTGQPRMLRQRVVAFWGGKGGTGRSTLVTAVADLLSRIPHVRVCTVDLSPSNSSLAALLRKEGDRNSWLTLSDSLARGSLTAQTVREALLPVQEGWSLLTGPAGQPQWACFLSPQTVAELVESLRADFDYILLDLPAGRTPVGDAALSVAQLVMVLVSPFYPDVLDTSRDMGQLVTEGLLSPDRCRLILSQWVESPELPAEDVSACLSIPVAAQVPMASAAALAAARSGRPVTQIGHPEAKALSAGAAAVAALTSEAVAGNVRRRSWFSKTS